MVSKFFVKTLGCKVNQVESAFITRVLTDLGWTKASSEGEANIFVLNTCVVTHKAQRECKKVLSRWIKANPKVVFVCGCYPQVFKDELLEFFFKKNFKNFCLLGQVEKLKPSNYVTSLTQQNLPRVEVRGRLNIQANTFPFLLDFPGRARAFVKVQDGCDNFCSYCIVPLTRGEPRSLAPEIAWLQIEKLFQKGYREFVLTGINLGKWGMDLTPKRDLAFLLGFLEKRLSIFSEKVMIRLSSLEPDAISPELLKALGSISFLCKHFHIPLQSGSNEILRLMQRKYDASFYEEVLKELYQIFPFATFGADVIVGFPGEGEREFSETVELIKKTPINWLHVFSFSFRKGTRAYEDLRKLPIPSKDEVKRRVSFLRELAKKKRREFLAKLIGKDFLAVVERLDGSKIKCLTENYVTVTIPLVKKEFLMPGRLIKVRITYLKEDMVFGEPVSALK